MLIMTHGYNATLTNSSGALSSTSRDLGGSHHEFALCVWWWLFTLILSPTFSHNSPLRVSFSFLFSSLRETYLPRLIIDNMAVPSFLASKLVTFRANCNKPSDEVISGN